MKNFTRSDVTDTNRIYCDKSELIDAPLWWQLQGLQKTASGYGAKIETTYKINFEGKKHRIYCTVYGNVGSCWFMTRGERIYVS